MFEHRRFRNHISRGVCLALFFLPVVIGAPSASAIPISKTSGPVQHEREHMQGEVDRAYAFVQSYSTKAVDGGHTFTAQIKIRRAGSYVVIAGFFKDTCWHKGTFSRTNYFKATRAQGEAGDVVNITIESVPQPPANRQNTVGVFNSLDDICTKG